MMGLYLKGIAMLAAFVAYPVLYWWIGSKIFKGDPWKSACDNNLGIIGALIIPWMVLIGFVAMMSMPLALGHAWSILWERP